MKSHQRENVQPHISVPAQYIKDLSFENPGAPNSLGSLQGTPQIDVSLDLEIENLPEEDFYKVELSIEAKTTGEHKLTNKNFTLFVIELKYAGIFHLINLQKEQHQSILAIDCAAMIFPFARKIIADVTQNGGFQPLMIDPIDFGALYNKKMGESAN